MVKIYENGTDFLAENWFFLKTDPYLSMFFIIDAMELSNTDKQNFAICAEAGDRQLLAIRLAPYSMVLFGDASAAPELLKTLTQEGFQFDRMLGSEELCDCVAEQFQRDYGIKYEETLAMDFMEADTVTEPSCPDVEIPTEADAEELYECRVQFNLDCGLQEKPTREHTLDRLSEFRILRQDGKIVSMASVSKATKQALKIANVYTRPEYRGKSLARKVVNTLKNEILAQGMTAVLNVDKKNPVSNQLYASLGFRRVFSQGEYRRS